MDNLLIAANKISTLIPTGFINEAYSLNWNQLVTELPKYSGWVIYRPIESYNTLYHAGVIVDTHIVDYHGHDKKNAQLRKVTYDDFFSYFKHTPCKIRLAKHIRHHNVRDIKSRIKCLFSSLSDYNRIYEQNLSSTYDLISNNCEHFAWSITALKKISPQSTLALSYFKDNSTPSSSPLSHTDYYVIEISLS